MLVMMWLVPVFAQPKLVVEEPVWDFGEVKNRAKVQHAFVLKNTGNSPLYIKRIVPACGCTIIQVNRLTIQPNRSAQIHTVVDLAKLGDNVAKHINVFSNDRTSPVFTLTVKGSVAQNISLSNKSINFKTISPTAQPTGTATLRANFDNRFKITSVKTQYERIDVDWKWEKEGTVATFTVNPKGQIGKGHFSDRVLIETNDPLQPKLRLLVLWHVETPVMVSPSTLIVRETGDDSPAQAFLLVNVSPSTKRDLQVKKVVWPGRDNIKATYTDTRSYGWRIHVSNIHTEKAMNGETLEIHTNLDELPVVKVPVLIKAK